MRNMVSPYRSQWETEPKGEVMAMRVEDRGESECLAVMAGIRTETLFDAKAGRLPRGLTSQENLINRSTGKGR